MIGPRQSKSDKKFDMISIVKLGGSAVTMKDVYETLNSEMLSQFVHDVRDALTKRPGLGLVIVHGAGSFGHFDAKQYGLRDGGSNERDNQWRKGFARTRASVVKLNGLIVQALVKGDVPAVAVPCFPLTKAAQRGTNVHVQGTLGSIREILDHGLVPVLHGDVVFTDDTSPCTILSGDVLMHELCTSSELRLCLRDSHRISATFLTDVPGIFNKSPKIYM